MPLRSKRVRIGRRAARQETARVACRESRSKLEYLDSTGIGILVTCCGKIEAAGGQLRIASVQPKVEDLMRVTKLHRLMRFHLTVEDWLLGAAR